MRRASIGLLLAAALLLWAPSAWASRSADSEGDPSGGITLTWHGDPARGCAAAGVCEVSGSLVYTPDSVFTYGELLSNGRFEPDELDMESGDPSTVRVRTGNSTSSSGLCLDLEENSFELDLRRGSGAHYRVGLFSGEGEPDGFSSGRCAGPLAQELATLFPIGSLDAEALGRHSAVLDLSQSRPFVAGPFIGELTSTIRARMPRVEVDDESSSSSDSSKRLLHKRRELILFMEYRVKQGAGSLATAFAGTTQPFCLPFDACGVRGSINYSASAAPDSGSLTIYARRRLGKREHVTLKSALRDLRANRLRLDPIVVPAEGEHARVSSSLSRPDGSTCTDPAESASPDLGVEQRRGSIRFELDASNDVAVDALRTHCQGPSEQDIRGTEPLAVASVTYRDLLRKTVRLHLIPKASFASAAYAGTLAGSFEIQLERVALQAGADFVYELP
jgi:hypothetical protein